VFEEVVPAAKAGTAATSSTATGATASTAAATAEDAPKAKAKAPVFEEMVAPIKASSKRSLRHN
jgi:hypothetical protein